MKKRLSAQFLAFSLGFIVLLGMVPVNGAPQAVSRDGYALSTDGVPLPPPGPPPKPIAAPIMDGLPLPPPGPSPSV